jgi:hypothetical protein
MAIIHSLALSWPLSHQKHAIAEALSSLGIVEFQRPDELSQIRFCEELSRSGRNYIQRRFDNEIRSGPTAKGVAPKLSQ